MPSLHFYKYCSTGDDIIVIDNRDGRYADFLSIPAQIRQLCDRTFGVGANLIIEIQPHATLTWNNRYLTPQGAVAKVCGNGNRASVMHFYTHILPADVRDQAIEFNAFDGKHVGWYDPATSTSAVTMADMGQVQAMGSREYFAHTGTAHYVLFVDKIADLDVVKEGRRINSEKSYLEPDLGYVNANFVEEREDGLHTRCYEAACTYEVHCCGTASVAIAMSHDVMKRGDTYDPDATIDKKIIWGDRVITVTAKRKGTAGFIDVKFSGWCKLVFEGNYNY